MNTPDPKLAAPCEALAVETCWAYDTPRTNAAVNAGGQQLFNVTECSRKLERELSAFKRSNERIIRDYNDRLAELRYAENMQRAAESENARVRKAALDQWAELRKTIHSLEAEVVALTAISKHLEDQRNTLNETCHALRAQLADRDGDELPANRRHPLDASSAFAEHPR